MPDLIENRENDSSDETSSDDEDTIGNAEEAEDGISEE